jgi:hypothetical protein
LDDLVANHGIRRALYAADLEAAHKAGQPAIVADGSTFSAGSASGRRKRISAAGDGWN